MYKSQENFFRLLVKERKMPFIIIIISFINCLKSKTPPNTLEKHYALLCHSNQILRKRNIFSRFFSRI